MNSPFCNDMFAIVRQAFQNLYPGFAISVCWSLNIPQPEKGHVCGVTSFCTDDNGGTVVLIDIDPTLRVVDAVEVFAHELAHVVAGEQEDHGDKWAAAYDAIHAEYDRIMCKMFPDGESITVKSGKDYVDDEGTENE